MNTPDSRNGPPALDTHWRSAVPGTTSHRSTYGLTSTVATTGRDQLNPDHLVSDPHRSLVGVARQPIDSAATNGSLAGGADLSDSQEVDGAQTGFAVVDGEDRAQSVNDPHRGFGPILADPLLALAADVLDDLERVRIANENRLRQLTRDEVDVDGLERGFGLTLEHPDVKRLAALVEALAKAEHDAELNLRRQLRQHPLGPWVKQARGVGEKQAARLLASIGDPYWNDLHERPRTVSELWAYAGYHVLRTGQGVSAVHATRAGSAPAGGDPDHCFFGNQKEDVGVAATRARGQKANWSATAKMRTYLVATSIVKAGGPYRAVYDDGRAKYAAATHQSECKRCGPAGKPAQPGTVLSDGHKHARALRLVAKAVLKDLWREARRLHELHDGQRVCDTHPRGAVVGPKAGDHASIDTHSGRVADFTPEVDR